MTRLRARGDDRGFTLIELVMSLTVLAIAIFGVTTVFAASIRTGAADVHRTNAVAIATQWRERMAVIPYADLGQQTGDTPACRTGSVVSGNLPANDTPTVSPVAGVTYTVNLCVVQPKPPSLPDAYKQTTVEVIWSDDTGTHAIWQDSAVYSTRHTQFDPTSTSTILATSSCVVSNSLGNSLISPFAVNRDADNQVPGSSVTVSAIANGRRCSDLWVIYQATAGGASTRVRIRGVEDGQLWSVGLPEASEVWDLGPHTITVVDDSGAQVAQGTACVVGPSSSLASC